MEGYQLRVIEEEMELSSKIAKLEQHLTESIITAENMHAVGLKFNQLSAMRDYRRVLKARIELFQVKQAA